MKDRFKKVFEFYRITAGKLEIEAGLSQGVISKYLAEKNSMTLQTFAKIQEKIPDINIDWLLTGRGEMLINKLEKDRNFRKTNEHSVVESFNESVKNLYEKVIEEKDERIAELNARIDKQGEYIETLMVEHKNELGVILELGRANNSMLKDGTSYINTIRTRVSGFQHGEEGNIVSKL